LGGRYPKDKRNQSGFLDNPSANMKVIVDKEKILGKVREVKFFQ
jgi:hypothetical protein